MESNKKISGLDLAQNVYDNIRKLSLDFTPRVVDVIFGSDPVAVSFIKAKAKHASALGWNFETLELSQDLDLLSAKKTLIELQEKYSSDLCGLIVQLPLPRQLNISDLASVIKPNLDVDCLNVSDNLLFPSPIVSAVGKIFDFLKINLENKKITLIGDGFLVGRPIANWLRQLGVQFAQADISTTNLMELTKDADIIISGVGRSGLISGDMVKDGVILIDAGTSEEAGVIRGDIETSAIDKSSYYTPVPGGVGPLTVACMLENVSRAALALRELTK